jgi:hypothetical protein
VEPVLVREDVDAVLAGIFDVNAKLDLIANHLAMIRILLGDDDGEAEENDR